MGECHYLDGNVYAEKRMQVVADLLELSGIGRKRMQLRWVSAAEGQLFADYVTQFSNQTMALGPFDPNEFKIQLEAVEQTLNSERVRWLTGMERQLTERENVYKQKVEANDYKELLGRTIKEEYEKALVLESLRDGPMLVREISQITGLPLIKVSWWLTDLKRNGRAAVESYAGDHPKFAVAA